MPFPRSVHGVLMQLNGVGALIMGQAGAGKSQLGLELLDRGHQLIADDVVDIHRGQDEIHGQAPERLTGFLALRCGIVVDVAAQFGPECLKTISPINLVVTPGPAVQPFESAPPCVIDGLEIPQFFLQHLAGSAVLLESICHAWQQKRLGYDAGQALAQRISAS